MSDYQLSSKQARELESLLKRYLSSKALGVYQLLHAACIKMECKQISALIFTDPEKLVRLLKSKYHDDSVVRFTLRVLILRPILIYLQILDMEEELVELLYKNPEEFKSFMVKKLIEHERLKSESRNI